MNEILLDTASKKFLAVFLVDNGVTKPGEVDARIWRQWLHAGASEISLTNFRSLMNSIPEGMGADLLDLLAYPAMREQRTYADIRKPHQLETGGGGTEDGPMS